MSLREGWCAQLAKLTYPINPEVAARAFASYLKLLEDMPDAAFTVRSLEAVATAPRRMTIPSYDEVRGPLAKWWRENRPHALGLPPPPIATRDLATEAERLVVADKVAAFKAELAARAVDRAEGRPPGRALRPVGNAMPPAALAILRDADQNVARARQWQDAAAQAAEATADA